MDILYYGNYGILSSVMMHFNTVWFSFFGTKHFEYKFCVCFSNLFLGVIILIYKHIFISGFFSRAYKQIFEISLYCYWNSYNRDHKLDKQYFIFVMKEHAFIMTGLLSHLKVAVSSGIRRMLSRWYIKRGKQSLYWEPQGGKIPCDMKIITARKSGMFIW